jgi:hypothetical protein
MAPIIRDSLFAFAFALAPVAAMGGDQPAPAPKPAMSPDLIISIELEDESDVWIVKDPQVADSLLRLKAPPARESLERLLGDSSMTVKIDTREEFRRHWRELELREGFRELRAQHAARDVDKGRIPRLYLFDSSMVVYPGWVVMRHKPRRRAGSR